MADELVTIGCRYPNGYVLEVGLQTTVRGGPKDGLVTQLQRMPGYQRIKLKGTHWHQAAIFRQGMRPPSILAPEPFINQVPKAFWEQWKKEHPNAPALLNRSIFEVKGDKNGNPDGANIKATIIDVMSRPQPLAPVDRSKPLTVGTDTVEQANFDDDDK